MRTIVDRTLRKIEECIAQDCFEELETEGLEVKSLPVETGQWKEYRKSVNAFLNTRGGIVILGIKEQGQGTARRYVLSGYRANAEPQLKETAHCFTDKQGRKLNLSEFIPDIQVRDFLDGRVAVVYIDELPADRKFCFCDGVAYKRILAGDHKVSAAEIDRQEEYKEEVLQARELLPVEGLRPEDLDLDKLNDYIHQLNRVVRVETIKPDLHAAAPFLERKCFVKNGAVTTLGMLVCGRHTSDYLGFRCQVHGYVDSADASRQVARDKQDFADNILPLMEDSLGYILRNTEVGISPMRGGMSSPQYPEELLRETVNNALAHRDYGINKQATIAIRPGVHVAIRNPGAFRQHLLVELVEDEIQIRRIIPEAKPRNPKLADVLRVYRKWEGRGIGMATLVNLCLENRIDLPYYQFYTEEVCLYLRAGSIFDDRMAYLFRRYDGYIEQRLQGGSLTENQKLVLSYLVKSEWANAKHYYTILPTPDNNHFSELLSLEKAGLISKHPTISTPVYAVYVVDRTLMREDYAQELHARFANCFGALDDLSKQILGTVYVYNHFSKARLVSAKQVSFALWYESGGNPGSIHEFDVFYRKVRNAFNKLEKSGFVVRAVGSRGGYELNPEFSNMSLL